MKLTEAKRVAAIVTTACYDNGIEFYRDIAHSLRIAFPDYDWQTAQVDGEPTILVNYRSEA